MSKTFLETKLLIFVSPCLLLCLSLSLSLYLCFFVFLSFCLSISVCHSLSVSVCLSVSLSLYLTESFPKSSVSKPTKNLQQLTALSQFPYRRSVSQSLRSSDSKIDSKHRNQSMILSNKCTCIEVLIAAAGITNHYA